MATTITETACGWCGEGLTPEEMEYPERDEQGDVICEVCWNDEYREYCARCGEWADKAEMSGKPGELIGVWMSAPGLTGRVRRGYYRVKEWPMYRYSAMSAEFYNDAIERVAPLDKAGRVIGRESDAPAGMMCQTCRNEVERHAERATADAPADPKREGE